MSITKKRIGKYLIFMKNKLGEGTFAAVYHGVEESTGEEVAIKVVSKAIEEDEYTKRAFCSQIRILKILKSNNIIRCYEVHETKNNFYIVLELSEKGTLRNQMINHGRFEEKVALKYIGQILNGFGELVLNGIIHRDLKPENILMKNDVIKIADFGFAKQTANGSLMNSIVGTPAYMAPQILSEQQYSYKCDIWALGVIMYELVVGRIPWTFKEKNLQSVCKQICTSTITFPPDLKISQNMRDLILGCLCIDEKKRLDWQSIFTHPLFGGKFNKSLENMTKGRGPINLFYTMTNLRFKINSDNINIEKKLSKYPKQFTEEMFFMFFSSLSDCIQKQDIRLIFHYISKNGVVLMQDLLDFFKHYNCLVTPRQDITKIEQEEAEFTEKTGRRTGFQIIGPLKMKIDHDNINIRGYLNRPELRKAEITVNEFSNLIRQIDDSLGEQDIVQLFARFFDVKQQKRISFDVFYLGMCKIAQITPYEPMEQE